MGLVFPETFWSQGLGYLFVFVTMAQNRILGSDTKIATAIYLDYV